MLGLAAPAWAGFDEGDAAYDRGDYATALREFHSLAEQGHAKAQWRLGAMYTDGRGVPQDYVQAHMWFNIATAQKVMIARMHRDEIVKRMTPAQIAEAQWLARVWWAAHGTKSARESSLERAARRAAERLAVPRVEGAPKSGYSPAERKEMERLMSPRR